MKKNVLFFHIILLSLIVQLISSCKVIKIEDNERGVVFKRFEGGIDTTEVYLPGKYKIPNHDKLIIYNVNARTSNEEINVLTKDEIKVVLEITYEFRPIPEKIPQLHFFIGENYLERIVKPSISKELNSFFKDKLSVEIKGINKNEIETHILNNSKKTLSKRYINLETFKVSQIIVQ